VVEKSVKQRLAAILATDVAGFSLHRLLTDRRGATAIEYGIIVAGISIVIIAALGALGMELKDVFESVVEALGGKCC
jgi:pilus assembly protein Flp/PilA